MKTKTSRTSPKSDKNEFSSFTSNGNGVVAITLEVMTDHFTTDELVIELCSRNIDDIQKMDLLGAMEVPTDIIDTFEEFNGSIGKMSMKDHLKFEHLMQIFSKYSLEEIEFKLPL